MSLLDRLISKVAVLTGSCSNLSESVTLVHTSALVNPDGPEAVDLINELCSALGEARLYVDECFGRADQNLSSHIDSLLHKAGKK